MREIKFRAWNKRRKKMDYCGDLYWFEENYVRDSDDNYWILMQYTGLKDNTRWDELTEVEQYQWVNAGNLPKHWDGRAMYEKDIVYYEICSRDDPAYGCYGDQLVVEFRDGSFKLCDGGREDLLSDYHDIVKVIGNIHENPELLVTNNDENGYIMGVNDADGRTDK